MAQQQAAKQRLIYEILRFLDGEIRAESVNAERRESMEGTCRVHLAGDHDINMRVF